MDSGYEPIRTKYDDAYINELEYKLKQKKWQVWHHSESLKLNVAFEKGNADEIRVWKQKIPVLDALLTYIDDRDDHKLSNVISQNFLYYAKGFFSRRTANEVDEVKYLVTEHQKAKRLSLPKVLLQAKTQEVGKDTEHAISTNAVIKEIQYKLAQKKLDVKRHLENLKLNVEMKSETASVDEMKIWNQKIRVLEMLLGYADNGNEKGLDEVIKANPLYNKGWFSTTDKEVDEIKELVKQLNKENRKEIARLELESQNQNQNNHSDRLFQPRVEEKKLKKPRYTAEERKLKIELQEKTMEQMLEESERLRQIGMGLSKQL